MKVSHTKVNMYEECGMKFKFRYKDHLVPDITSTPLLYGRALDEALNYILESLRDKKEYCIGKAKDIFVHKMSEWDGQNQLDFFKNEVPKELQDDYDPYDLDTQEAVWDNIVRRGLASIDVYVNDVLPQIKEVIEVQSKGVIKNEEEDEFEFVVDFVAKLQDDRVVLFDNKSASAKYPKNSVIKSRQLSLYLENYPDIKYAGYIVLIKNPEREKGLTHQILVDEIPEETIAESYQAIENAIKGIKEERFEPNLKSCRLFNKPCAYMGLCKYGQMTGLKLSYDPNKSKKEKSPKTKD